MTIAPSPDPEYYSEVHLIWPQTAPQSSHLSSALRASGPEYHSSFHLHLPPPAADYSEIPDPRRTSIPTSDAANRCDRLKKGQLPGQTRVASPISGQDKTPAKKRTKSVACYLGGGYVIPSYVRPYGLGVSRGSRGDLQPGLWPRGNLLAEANRPNAQHIGRLEEEVP